MQTNLIATILITTSAAGVTFALEPPSTAASRDVDASREEVVRAIRRVLDRRAIGIDELQRVAADVAAKTRSNLFAQQTLAAALAPTATKKELRNSLEEVVELLSFKPVDEAPLPAGFPAPTPLGEIQVIQYPAYRLARTRMRQDEAFWELFRHIQANDIAMTAPVEMTYDVTGRDGPREREMAFLYRNVEQGEIGTNGNVEVVDVPSAAAVSIGMRGDMTPQSVAIANESLQGWLKAHADQYEAAGKLRVMGYNSPFVPVGKRYFEVQIPLRSK